MINPNHQDGESAIGDSHHTTVQGERHYERSRRKESPHDESHPERSHRERSPTMNLILRGLAAKALFMRDLPVIGLIVKGPIRRDLAEKRSHHGESHNNRHDESAVNAKVEDLKRKYADMARQITEDEVKSTARKLLEDTHLPFSDRVMAFPILDKFKMPCVDKYDGRGDPIKYVENIRAHLILHGIPDEIACRAFLLTLA